MWFAAHANTALSGVTFASRLGDDLALWAFFERAGDSSVSPTLTAIEHHPITPESPVILEAFDLLGLRWADPG